MQAGGRRFDPVWLHHFLKNDGSDAIVTKLNVRLMKYSVPVRSNRNGENL